MREFTIEPTRGLPEALPEGERILWQGAPSWRALAQHAFHVRRLTLYFGLLVVLQAVVQIWSGADLATTMASALTVAPLAVFAIAIVTLVAWANARAAVYTITNRRVVMRFGVALPMSINLPFSKVKSAAVRHHADGVGDIPLQMADDTLVSFPVLWPFVRPWRLSATEPMLRAVPDVAEVAEILGDALAAAGQGLAHGQVQRTARHEAAESNSSPLGAMATAE